MSQTTAFKALFGAATTFGPFYDDTFAEESDAVDGTKSVVCVALIFVFYEGVATFNVTASQTTVFGKKGFKVAVTGVAWQSTHE